MTTVASLAPPAVPMLGAASTLNPGQTAPSDSFSSKSEILGLDSDHVCTEKFLRKADVAMPSDRVSEELPAGGCSRNSGQCFAGRPWQPMPFSYIISTSIICMSLVSAAWRKQTRLYLFLWPKRLYDMLLCLIGPGKHTWTVSSCSVQ